MDETYSIEALSALAQPTRLQAFRLLVRGEPAGVPAGELARRLHVPQNTLSSHFSILAKAGLVRSERQSRSIIYRADLTRFRQVLLFLLADCCNGHPEVCASVRESLAALEARSNGGCWR